MTDDDLTPPAKRNVKALTAFLGDLESDDAVVATLATDRYGVFVLRGLATFSQSLGAFAIGGHPLDSNRKPAKALQLVRTFHSAEREAAASALGAEAAGAAAAGVAGASPEAGAAASKPAHGDLVRATIEEEAYGQFDVTGVAVRSAVDESLLVGGWIVSTAGTRAPRVVGLEVVEPAGAHALAVPREITAWGNEAAADV